MQNAARGNRLHIGIFGRTNVGKSSLLNFLTKQDVAIVSAQPGTTTDPIEKYMELLPLGPVVFIDTAGLDDEGILGAARIARSRKVFERTDLALLVTTEWTEFEQKLLEEFTSRKIPTIVVANKCDVAPFQEPANWHGVAWIATSTIKLIGLEALRALILKLAPDDFLGTQALVGDLLPEGGLAVLVTPIDMEAPRGRLILPQVQTIRDILDHDAMAMVVKERELAPALAKLRAAPDLVVTDSQAFLKVGADVPLSVPMTSFSILMARLKGDLSTFVSGAKVIDSLQAGSRVLIAESCTHHSIGDDIGRVKIPRWLRQRVGVTLHIDHVQGHDFPANLEQYALVVQCGGCMNNRREMLFRILRCQSAGVPITNYGLAIAHSLGIMERAILPFGITLAAK